MGKLLFNVLAMVAEFEGDLIGLRTKEGMKIATVYRALDRARVKEATASVQKTKRDK